MTAKLVSAPVVGGRRGTRLAGLRVLDLRALPRDDGPPTELQARREKFVFFEKKCSEVVKGVCVAGELVARDRALLQESGITHIVNCIGMLCPPCFPADFTYLTLYLYGKPFLNPVAPTAYLFVQSFGGPEMHAVSMTQRCSLDRRYRRGFDVLALRGLRLH